MRRKPWAFDALKKIDDYFIESSKDYKGKWRDVFGNDHPIHAEFGGGKGQFIIQMAEKNPGVNFIMVDVVTEVALAAAQRMENSGLKNVKVILADLREVETYFENEELERIYLNFSDPWPKAKHYKRRLTYRDFLKKYEDILIPEGWIHFKTDNKGLFQFSLNEFAALDMKMQHISLDLHQEKNVELTMTEYEEKFSSMGHPIYRVEAQFRA